jgi:hypothetical protein
MKIVFILLLFLGSGLNAQANPEVPVVVNPEVNAVTNSIITVVAPTPTPIPRFTFAFTTAIAFPQPLTIGVQVHSRDAPNFDVFYQAGFFRYPLGSSDRSFSDYSIEAGVRYHPFGNWFYTTAELGFRHVGVVVDLTNLKQDGVQLANSATLSLGTFYAGVLVGGEWKVSTHFSLAFDMGVEIAIIHTGGLTIQADSTEDPDPNDLQVDDSLAMGRISGLPLPTIGLLRLIWWM